MIQPEYKPLIDILNNKLFKIAEYQRHYSWQKKQRNDLFEDIKKLKKIKEKFKDRVHFMATIVCLKTQESKQVGSNLYPIYEVVDGQQRLTTLIILLKNIIQKLNRNNDDKREAEDLGRLLVKDDGRLIILQNNHDNRHILRNYLKEGRKPDKNDITTDADKNLNEAIRDCEKFVDSWDGAIELLSLIKNCLYFIFQTVEDKGAVYTIFEVLNSRGLEVDWLDKCKSLLMGLLYEFANDSGDGAIFYQHLNDLHSYWSEIYREIGLKNIPGHEIIRFAATLKSKSKNVDSRPSNVGGRPLTAEDALEFFKEDCIEAGTINEKINRVIDNTLYIKEITKCLSNLYSDERRNAVTDITQARLLAVSIMLRKDLSEEDRDRLLEQWERTTFRIYGMFRKDSRTKVGDYVRTAKKIYQDSQSTVSALLQSIVEIGNEFKIEDALKELENADCYNSWQDELCYFLYCYEEYLVNQNHGQIDTVTWKEIWEANPNDTIEHILPQDKSEKCWDHISEEDHNKFVNNFGNLALLSPSLNSEAKNKCFSDKKEIYRRTNLYFLREITELNDWNKSSILERRDKLLKFAEEQWKDLI